MAKKIKNSKFNVTGEDVLSEQMFGEGAVRLGNCRMGIRNGKSQSIDTIDGGTEEVTSTVLFGIAIHTPNMVNGDEAFQMWECEVIIIPRKKYRRGLRLNKGRIDRVLCGGQIGDPDCWEEEIFDKNS